MTNYYYGIISLDENLKKINNVIIKKGTIIPTSVKWPIYAWGSETKYIKMEITESRLYTTDLKYVGIIFNLQCLIPKTTYPGAGRGIILEINIDQDGIVKCEFKDGENGTVLPHENIDDNNKLGLVRKR